MSYEFAPAIDIFKLDFMQLGTRLLLSEADIRSFQFKKKAGLGGLGSTPWTSPCFIDNFKTL